MGKQFIVITEVGKMKETFPWWERSCSACIEAILKRLVKATQNLMDFGG